MYELEALRAGEIRGLLDRAVAARRLRPADRATPEALDFLAERSGGDARTALNALELACEAAGPGQPVTLAHAEDALQRRALLYDRQADRHYDTISAWIKATRGSDPDASLYYLAVMLEGGEDPRFIVRRMVVLASEDIGNADPAGARGRHRGRRRGRARGACPSASSPSRRRPSTCLWRPSPTRPSAPCSPRASTSASAARAAAAAAALLDPQRRRTTTTRTGARATSRPRS